MLFIIILLFIGELLAMTDDHFELPCVIYSEEGRYAQRNNSIIDKEGYYDTRNHPSLNFLEERGKKTRLTKSLFYYPIAFLSYNTVPSIYPEKIYQALKEKTYLQAPQTIFSQLYMPTSLKENNGKKIPAFIISPASLSLSLCRKSIEKFTTFLTSRGYAVFVIDHFKSRRFKEEFIHDTLYNQLILSYESQVIDAFQALKLLATHPLIDSSRIGILGFSRGGTVADCCSRVFYQKHLSPTLSFSSHLAFYPAIIMQEETPVLTGAPIRYFVGEKDEVVNSTITKLYSEKLQRYSYDSHCYGYANAPHAFNTAEMQSFGVFILNKLYDAQKNDNFPSFIQKMLRKLSDTLAALKGLKGFHHLQVPYQWTYIYKEGKFIPLEKDGTEKPSDSIDRLKFFLKNTVTYGAHLFYDLQSDQKSLNDMEDFLKQKTS
jgi:dienelactone hydrolase